VKVSEADSRRRRKSGGLWAPFHSGHGGSFREPHFEGAGFGNNQARRIHASPPPTCVL